MLFLKPRKERNRGRNIRGISLTKMESAIRIAEESHLFLIKA
jgi:hypothetical protein